MTQSKIDTLTDKINRLNGKNYPAQGYLMYADIIGDGTNKRKLYVTTTCGVMLSEHHADTRNQIISNLENLLSEILSHRKEISKQLVSEMIAENNFNPSK